MTQTATHRVYNFSAGPCTLPLEVLEQVQAELVDYQNTGMSIIEMSHRSRTVTAVHEKAMTLVKELLSVGDDHQVLLLGGGATAQFGMVPMNLLQDGGTADYTHSGAWAKKAIADGKKYGDINVIWSGEDQDFMTLPDPASLQLSDSPRYLHLTSNETIGGVQWKQFPQVDTPLVCDMSSDIMSRPIPVERFGIIYAGAQKNIGPAGVAMVIIRKDVLEQASDQLPLYFSYKKHADADSMLNTPPVFQIYFMSLVLDWLKGKGGLAWAQEMADRRSTLLYDTIKQMGDYYRCPVDPAFRSTMNVVWRLPSEELEAKFIKEADAAGLSGLKGHRSVGGCRASIYNAMPIEGVEALTQFMRDFAAKNG
jgi:phosphoserine aminotransferase